MATTVIVTAADLDNTSPNPAVVAADGLNKWFMYNDTLDTIDNTLGSFVQGPDTPPHGRGSVQFIVEATPLNRKNIATFQFQGMSLASITAMAFSAYSHSGVAAPTESPFLNFNVDFIGSSSTFQGRLNYVPSANLPGGLVPQDTWNTFDVIDNGNALWTWSRYMSSGNMWPDGNPNQYRTWGAIKTAFPNARLLPLPIGGWLGVRVGSPTIPPGYTGNIDSFTWGIASGTTIFEFEPAVSAQPITAFVGTAFSGQVALGYATAGFAGPFSATINWGDGTASSGTVTVSGSNFTVSGSHTYANTGTFPLTLPVNDTTRPTFFSSRT